MQHVDFSIGEFRLVRVFEEIKSRRALSLQIVCGNGTEFTSHAFRKWAAENQVAICSIDKDNPTQNAFVESFNGKFRDECLKEERFVSIEWARSIIEVGRIEYNSDRPLSGLNDMNAV